MPCMLFSKWGTDDIDITDKWACGLCSLRAHWSQWNHKVITLKYSKVMFGDNMRDLTLS